MAERDTALLERFWSLHTAVLRRDGLDSRRRAGAADGLLVDRALTAAEVVIEARASLHRCLIAQGWAPPPGVVRDLEHDELLLSGPIGSGALA